MKTSRIKNAVLGSALAIGLAFNGCNTSGNSIDNYVVGNRGVLARGVYEPNEDYMKTFNYFTKAYNDIQIVGLSEKEEELLTRVDNFQN